MLDEFLLTDIIQKQQKLRKNSSSSVGASRDSTNRHTNWQNSLPFKEDGIRLDLFGKIFKKYGRVCHHTSK